MWYVWGVIWDLMWCPTVRIEVRTGRVRTQVIISRLRPGVSLPSVYIFLPKIDDLLPSLVTVRFILQRLEQSHPPATLSLPRQAYDLLPAPRSSMR